MINKGKISSSLAELENRFQTLSEENSNQIKEYKNLEEKLTQSNNRINELEQKTVKLSLISIKHKLKSYKKFFLKLKANLNNEKETLESEIGRLKAELTDSKAKSEADFNEMTQLKTNIANLEEKLRENETSINELNGKLVKKHH